MTAHMAVATSSALRSSESRTRLPEGLPAGSDVSKLYQGPGAQIQRIRRASIAAQRSAQDQRSGGPASKRSGRTANGPRSNGASTGKFNRTANENSQMPDREAQPLEGGSLESTVPGLRRTVWDQQDLRPTYPTLRENLRADVVVVGAGIAGLSVAYNLAKAGKKVVVLEAKCIGSGQTGKTTAHLMPWNDDYYMILEQLYGRKKTALIGDSHRKAIDFVEDVVEEEGIRCEFTRVDGYLFPHDKNQSTKDMLLSEYAASRRAGFQSELVDLRGDPRSGSIREALKFPGAADFHPLKYICGLAAAIQRLGGRIFEQSSVFGQDGTTVTTKDNYSVTAGDIVYATNSPINHNLAIHARQPADRTYVVGLKVDKGEIEKSQWWDTASPYHYIRIEEKEDYDVLVVGGSDHPVGVLSPREYPPAWEDLEQWARRRWTTAGEVIYKWTGMVYKPVDLLGLYSQDPLNLNPHIYVATGDSGQGMTGGTLAGIIIADCILGRRNPWADVYNASRPLPPHPTVAQGLLAVTNHTLQGYVDNLPGVGNDFVSISKIAANSGAVINQGIEKVAVYKDEKGIAHKFSAVCPHLKCAVKWNPKDGTFDCPCHGSQFDNKGRCVNGPAKANLPSLS